MNIIETGIQGLLLTGPKVHKDSHVCFMEFMYSI